MKPKLYWYKGRGKPQYINHFSLKNKGLKRRETCKVLCPPASCNVSHVNRPYPCGYIWKETFSASSWSHGKRAVMATSLPSSPSLRNNPHHFFRAPLCSFQALRRGSVCALAQAAPGARVAYGMGLSYCHAGRPALKENKTQTNFSGHCRGL